ncbi:hypothetical protein K5F93_19975 [Pseudomonas protegens]|uniref:hypothetical protein n=1 Tax=Pseudomonas protegens TaxID=380021 RepID=UPI001C8ED76A|nr:hypothetical protein [Pseudomonas protegens]QZI68668.1 hypothetical protein K5F93_19975 [Pseudomonas protegens]
MGGSFIAFLGLALGLAILILVCPKFLASMREHKHAHINARRFGSQLSEGEISSFKNARLMFYASLLLSLVLMINFLAALYFLRNPTEGMLKEKYDAADAARREKNFSECQSKISAFTAANLEVKRRLKDPSSADFPWPNDSGVLVKKMSGTCTFLVNSRVSAKNSFGAYVPQSFEAVVRFDLSSGSWNLVSLNMQQ